MFAYVDVDPAWFDRFGEGIDDDDAIAETYAREHGLLHLGLHHTYDERLALHKIWCYTSARILWDSRFSDTMYHRHLAKTHGRPFPYKLRALPYSLNDSEDAIEIAEQLRVFFAGDREIQAFADWCELTAPHCCAYECDR